ncbi:MAG: methyl-accepting chemotaxis protein [Candidatus Endonucleobacter bathymodioli]|uniref:Methyl-accepting chemotaxis protein n=1 Tax=Candidatus Endonucleibacter bathymodioli TaxID=539814 RepID=A0AA90STV6_9GAMM|nr:methyl-accepting chemotaxis protein [Candidatus Endonucleobacter bathymodioli]
MMSHSSSSPKPGARQSSTRVAPIALLTVSLVILAYTFVFMGKQSTLDQEYITSTNELRVLSLQIAKNARAAVSGKVEAFAFLQDTSNKFGSELDKLKQSSFSVIPTSLVQQNTQIKTSVKVLEDVWSAINIEVASILAAEERVLSLHRLTVSLEEIIPQIQIEYDEIIELLLDSELAADQIAIAQRQSWLAERIVNSTKSVIIGGESSIVAAERLGRDAKLFARVLVGMMNGNAALGIKQVTNEEVIDRLVEVADLFSFVNNRVNDILEISPELFQVNKEADLIRTDTQQILQQASIMASNYKVNSQAGFILQMLAIVASVVVLFSLLLSIVFMNRDARKRHDETKEHNEVRASMMRLLDEMAGLSDGDFMSNDARDEDFTGAIDDSINYAIEQLRVLVKTINHKAEEVDGAAQKSQIVAKELAEASKRQVSAIDTTKKCINEMVQSIDQMSLKAFDSASVTQRSLSITASGIDIVRNTLEGMYTIKAQIQDTSRCLKRLGESSHRIDNITSLITDIAEQTNILSLNASLQASMAGESGRGFGVEADEVQRLSKRVIGAIKQMETLVIAIHSDTNDAITSMELTTVEIVNGSQLAQSAVVVLEELEGISSKLAKLVNDISDTAQGQAKSVAQISSRMKVIHDITIRTSSSTNATASSFGNLAGVALDMRKSVSGFRLHETES